jgi:YidC/Oxa1 family membrane protein insertase
VNALMAVSWFQGLLNGIGAVLAWLYDRIPNYGVAIIVLTLAIRVLLLPLAMKQIRSMQAMQAVAPKQKEIQRKYKGNRQKINEETMRLYKEEGVNPLSGCFPLLAQFPVLIALFAVLSVPKGLPHVQGSSRNPTKLYQDIQRSARGVKFLGANLVCSATEAGRTVVLSAAKDHSYPSVTKNCGKGGATRIPYYLFLAAMIGTTYYQQKQMQRASPTQNQQQQMLARIMPVFFGFIGINFPAGLVVYWTTTNLVQVVQQHFMLPKPEQVAARAGKDGGDGGKPRSRDGRPDRNRPGGHPGGKGALPGKGQPRPQGGGNGSDGKRPPEERGESPSSEGGPGRQAGGAGRRPGGNDAGNRKKRRKR